MDGDRVFFRSLATRRAGSEIPDGLADVIAACKAAGSDLVIVETPGIGQGDAAIVPFVDFSLYVMTPEFGAASQLEKIDMLDFADAVVINKFERRGAEDARRDVARQLVRNREAFGVSWEDMPVFGTCAATFNDDGVTALYQHLRGGLAEHGLAVTEGALPVGDRRGRRPPRQRSCLRRGPATCPTSPTPCAATTARPTNRSTRSARTVSSLPRRRRWRRPATSTVGHRDLVTEARRKVDRDTEALLARGPRRWSSTPVTSSSLPCGTRRSTPR